jgi:hypothetical protein
VYLDSGKSTASSGRNKHFTGKFQKKGPITFNPEVVSIKTIVYLLSSIGYEPYISLEIMKREVI